MEAPTISKSDVEHLMITGFVLSLSGCSSGKSAWGVGGGAQMIPSRVDALDACHYARNYPPLLAKPLPPPAPLLSSHP